MRCESIKHQFVEFIPETLEHGTVYISIRFATASHLCCCGCGQRTVTPISPTDWKLTFNGKTVSLDPSIGNWGFSCQSHYWIRNNQVRWVSQWSLEEIETGREQDRLAKVNYYQQSVTPEESLKTEDSVPRPRSSVWQKIKRWLVGSG